MNVNEEIKSFFNIGWIESKQDLENVLKSTNDVEQEIFEILNDFGYENHNLYQTEANLNLSDHFYNAYWKRIGFPSSLEVVDNIEENRELLKYSIAVCDDLTPLFIRSLQCHHLALQKFFESQKLAISLMVETGKIAENISTKYDEIGLKFRSTREKVCKTLLNLQDERMPICQMRRSVAEESIASILKERISIESIASILEEESIASILEEASMGSIASILEKGVGKIDTAHESLMKNQEILLDTIFFWKRVTSLHINSLTDPNLANSDLVDLMQSEGWKESQQEYIETLKDMERNLVVIPRENLKNVMNSMKSGNSIIDMRSTPIANLVEQTGRVEEEFEKSCFKWLALAKVNLTMINSMENVLNGLNTCQMKISQLETTDELVKALQTEAKYLATTRSNA